MSVLEFPLPVSCLFSFLHFLPPCNIFLLLWLFFAIGSIHQEAQAVKFNCSCASGFTDCSYLLPISSSIVSCTSGFTDCSFLLPFFKFNFYLYFRTSQATIVFYHFSSSIVTVFLNYSGYNYFLRLFSISTVYFFIVLFVYHYLFT
jgi:hypothetical protein